jgi:prepilin-type N-terminal cleavage/methylation domain-containing protein
MRLRSRPGFTLVEVIAAIAIGSVLIAAVYGTLTFMLRSIQVGKEAVASMQVIRGTAIRISTDLRQSLSLMMSTPSIASQLAASSGSGGTTGGTGTGTTGGTTTTTPDPAQFNFCLQGDTQSLTIYASREPRYSAVDAESPNSVFSDLRIIQYSLTSEGLVRQEMANVLAGDPMQSSLPEIIAPEVKDLQFQYYDPSQATWVQQWDGTTNGPPAAVEVTITVQMPDEGNGVVRAPVTHRFVVAIPTAGSPIPPATQ